MNKSWISYTPGTGNPKKATQDQGVYWPRSYTDKRRWNR
jgi:hypothetical protein